MKINKLIGANMDIDLCTQSSIDWQQSSCPWNKTGINLQHKYAIKNTSICPYFQGVEYLDTVLCSYPEKL